MKSLLLSALLLLSFITNLQASVKDELIVKTIAQLSASSLYEMNYDRLSNVMQPFTQNKNIIAIEVIDAISDESVFLEYKDADKTIYDKAIPQKIKNNYFKKEKKIFYEKEEVGTIIVYYYDDGRMIKLTKEERDLISKLPPLLYSEIDWKPMSIINDGKMSGVMGDYLNLISDKTGITFKYVKSKTWNEVLNKFKEKSVDVIPGVLNVDCSPDFGLTTDAYIEYPLAIVAKKPFDEDISIEFYNGKTLAIPEHYTSCNYIQENYPDIKIIKTKTIEEAFKLVSFSQADASVEQISVANHYIESLHLTNLSVAGLTDFKYKHRVLVQSERPWLQELFNRAIESIDAKKDREIAARWIETSIAKREKIKFSKEEKQWIKENPEVTYTGDPDWLPFEATDGDGNHIGIASDYVKEIAELTGIKFNYVATKSWSQSLQIIKNDEVDMIVETTGSDLSSILKFTEPFIENSVVIVMNDKASYIENLYSIKDKKIAVVKEYGYVSKLKKEYPQIDFYEVQNITEGLTAVSTSKYDALLCTFSLGIYTISELGLQNLKVVGKTPVVTSVAFGIKNSHEPLVNVINKALNRVDEQTKHKFLNKWVQHEYIEKVNYALIYQIIFGISLILLAISIWIMKERKAKKNVERLNDIIEDERKTLTTIMDSQENLVITTNGENLVTANKAFLSFFQLDSLEEFKGCICERFEDDEDQDYLQKETDGESWIDYVRLSSDITHLAKIVQNELVYIFKVTITNMNSKNHTLYTVVLTDITQIKNIQTELILAKIKAEESTKLKSEFLANMSHEIRTPMNAVLGFADLLSETRLNAQQKNYTESIKSGAKTLLTIINDILDLSKIEANKLTLEYESVNPFSVFNDLTFIFSQKIKEKNLAFSLTIDSDLPTSLIMDQTRTKQILFNLIGNAIKFTSSGSVEINVKVLNRQENSLDLSVEVKDSGIGIPKNQFDKVFRKFEQTDGQSNREYGGTGLGLPICVNLAELMGGEIKLSSVEGVGSTFTLKLYGVKIGEDNGSTQTQETVPQTERRKDIESAFLYSEKSLKRRESLTLSLKEELNGSYKKAQDGIFEDITLFSANLAKIAKEYEFRYLQEYADALNEYVESFDVEMIETTLKEYPKIIKDLDNDKE